MNMKEKILVQRDSEGKLLPITVDIPDVGTVSIIPLTRGDIFKILNDKTEGKDSDLEIVKQCLFDPKLTDDEFKFVKYSFIQKVAAKVFEISNDSKGDSKN